MGEFDRDGDGKVDMRIEATEQAVAGLRQVADDLAGKLAGLLAVVDGHAAGLHSNGNLGKEFIAGYRARNDGAGTEADPGLHKAVLDVSGIYQEIADFGAATAQRYREAEQAAADQLRRPD